MIIMTIKVPVSHKVALGHQAHVTGTGVHLDKRTKRNRTRSQQKVNFLREHRSSEV